MDTVEPKEEWFYGFLSNYFAEILGALTIYFVARMWIRYLQEGDRIDEWPTGASATEAQILESAKETAHAFAVA